MKMMVGSPLMAAIGISVTSVPASAQDVGSVPEVAVAQEATPADGIADIVVTATKRAESAQRVPISISALSASDLTAIGATDTKSLTQAVPALHIFSVGNIAQVYLRGIGTGGGSLGDESAVAMYIDGVYQPTPVGGVFALNNIRAIEVDKGPQGTLFGRNSTGGVIQISTYDPSYNTKLDATATYANYDTVKGAVYATTGLSKTVAADVALYYNHQGDGWGRNIATGRDVYRRADFAVRNKWLWQAGAGTVIKLAFDYNYSRSDTDLAFRVIPPAVLQGQPAFPGFYNVNINAPPMRSLVRVGYRLWLIRISASRRSKASRLIVG